MPYILAKASQEVRFKEQDLDFRVPLMVEPWPDIVTPTPQHVPVPGAALHLPAHQKQMVLDYIWDNVYSVYPDLIFSMAGQAPTRGCWRVLLRAGRPIHPAEFPAQGEGPRLGKRLDLGHHQASSLLPDRGQHGYPFAPLRRVVLGCRSSRLVADSLGPRMRDTP